VSIDSALIVRKDRLPTRAALIAAIAETGVSIDFPASFRPDRTADDRLAVTVDGDRTDFDFRVQPLADIVSEDLPEGAADWGDTVLWFGARGALSAQTVSLIQEVLGRRYEAALMIDGELVPPTAPAAAGEPPADLDPDFAATMRGTPAERAAAMERYVAKHYPPIPVDPHARTKDLLKQLIVPILIFAALGGFYLWSQIK
jgi:hypothetical protein